MGYPMIFGTKIVNLSDGRVIHFDRSGCNNDDEGRIVSSIIHPSPGNPQANNGWNEKTIQKMKELGLWK